MEQASVDWAVAMRAGATLVPPGPELESGEISAVVDDLRRAAERSVELVAEVTELSGPASSVTLVVDRPGWLAAAASSANAMLLRAGVLDEPHGLADRLRARALGTQAGAVLAVVATRILGQFDPFADPSRLLLVAPNVVGLERKLGALPRDFRLWVCLHEQTHSFQFGAAPWLREHLTGLIAEVVADEDPDPGHKPQLGLAGLLGGPEQRAAFDRATAVMSLMEGHADVMMDRVPAGAVPTLPSIRAVFEQHRDQGGFSGLVSRLFGLNLKREQYRDGAGFCQAVIAEAGVPTLNRAFASAEALPSLAEIHDPQLWLRRI
ncbi:putative hydrolase/coenzyme F420 biosynthesis associated uncharacterized protein [Propionicimonas paludicola]|uniref:Putative hydrolase/coenzyme F420 biosynthesis associated uncharacterized protein n=1 Tax=Propionicimonas paludicola TaxID=185243 RepID=A0A2A9CVR0_9ACTN|nr:zinc-dependent metalloprotease [Propionicimonas paludicola]PFG17720.1 putative hydrolase/coenzyme F420 biosynthesis associated uncharacterized protein [Propionicimonas paludicola]